MRILIQKVKQASVSIDDKLLNQIEKGFVVFVGVTHDDTVEDVRYCARKVSQMRLFEDEDGKTNLALKDVDGDILSISQFTLHARTKKGNRPSFVDAAEPEKAEKLYQIFNDVLRKENLAVKTGQFGAYMEVELSNDGPMTILIDSKNKEL